MRAFTCRAVFLPGLLVAKSKPFLFWGKDEVYARKTRSKQSFCA